MVGRDRVRLHRTVPDKPAQRRNNIWALKRTVPSILPSMLLVIQHAKDVLQALNVIGYYVEDVHVRVAFSRDHDSAHCGFCGLK
jgi:hypothetical protein